MAGRFYLIGFVAGIVLIVIGGITLFVSGDEFAFIRGMMIIITGVIVLALGIRFRALKM